MCLQQPRDLAPLSIMITARTLLKTAQLDPRQLALAREAQATDGHLGHVAAELGCENEGEALALVAETLGLEVIDLASTEVDLSLLEGFPLRLIHRHGVFPIRTEQGSLVVATGNPFDLHALDAVGAATGKSVLPVLAAPDELAKLVKAHLGVGAETIDGLIARDEERHGVEVLDEIDWDQSEDSEAAQQASVVRLVNEILEEAVEARASDIHIESQAKGLKIRYRIDGILQKQPLPPELNRFQAAIISRLKIMARLNIAEKRVPQDGRIKLKVSGREVDVRVSIIPMLHGEGIVMRVLDKDKMQFSLRGVGMDEDTYGAFRKLIQMPHGIVLVTGPTGSGKTTTLYSALNEIKDEETKIVTTEDPIEYQLEGINQIQVHNKVGFDVRGQSSGDFASRPRRGADRRNPRSGDGRERRASLAHRPLGLQYASHQRRGRGVHADDGHGCRAVSGQQHRRGRHGPAAGSHALSGVSRGLHATPGRPAGRLSFRRVAQMRRASLPTRRLPRVPRHRIRRAFGDLRVAGGQRRDTTVGRRACWLERDQTGGCQGGDADASPRRLAQGNVGKNLGR